MRLVNAPDPAWLDAEYNALAAHPDHASLFARWREASAHARAQLPCRLDLHYGDGPLQTVDWFPAAQPGAPTLVFIHGGFWRGSDKALFSFLAPSFVAAGASVVLLNHDLCPAVTVEDIALQMTRALRWVHRELALRGGGVGRVVISGHSAGGHLAAMLLACDWKQVDRALPTRWVSRALAISGLYELEPLREAPFLGSDLRLTPQSVQRLSPARFASPAGTVLHTVVGALESGEFIRQTRLIAQRWGSQVVPVCELVEQRRHFDVLDDLADPAGRLHALACELLGLRA